MQINVQRSRRRIGKSYRRVQKASRLRKAHRKTMKRVRR
jgi:hypothetical protein